MLTISFRQRFAAGQAHAAVHKNASPVIRASLGADQYVRFSGSPDISQELLVLKMAKSEDPQLRQNAYNNLKAIEDPETFSAIFLKLSELDPAETAGMAERLFLDVTGPRQLAALKNLLISVDPDRKAQGEKYLRTGTVWKNVMNDIYASNDPRLTNPMTRFLKEQGGFTFLGKNIHLYSFRTIPNPVFFQLLKELATPVEQQNILASVLSYAKASEVPFVAQAMADLLGIPEQKDAIAQCLKEEIESFDSQSRSILNNPIYEHETVTVRRHRSWERHDKYGSMAD